MYVIRLKRRWPWQWYPAWCLRQRKKITDFNYHVKLVLKINAEFQCVAWVTKPSLKFAPMNFFCANYQMRFFGIWRVRGHLEASFSSVKKDRYRWKLHCQSIYPRTDKGAQALGNISLTFQHNTAFFRYKSTLDIITKGRGIRLYTFELTVASIIL